VNRKFTHDDYTLVQPFDLAPAAARLQSKLSPQNQHQLSTTARVLMAPKQLAAA
jgi:hypothetical protein